MAMTVYLDLKSFVTEKFLDLISKTQDVTRDELNEDLKDPDEQALFANIIDTMTDIAEQYASFHTSTVLMRLRTQARAADESSMLKCINEELAELKSHDETKKD
jgi:hypothetical protein